jgi:hypothetical protein
MREGWRRRCFLSLAVLGLSLACSGGSDSPTESMRVDAIRIVSISPTQGAELRIGETPEVVARLSYRFAQAEGGRVSVLSFPAPIGFPILTDPLIAGSAVTGRDGEVTLRFRLLLDDPDAELGPGDIIVDFSLFPTGQTQTSTIAQARFRLVR